MENGHVLAMRRENEKENVVECDNCHKRMTEHAIKYWEEYFCDEDCLHEHLIQNAEYEHVDL